MPFSSLFLIRGFVDVVVEALPLKGAAVFLFLFIFLFPRLPCEAA